MSYYKNSVYPIHYDPSDISTLHEILKDAHCFTEAQRQSGEKDKNQEPILCNCFPGFSGITIDKLSSLLYSCDDLCNEPSNCHGISPSIIQLISHMNNWFMESSEGVKWGIQSRCVCNTSGTYNVSDINPAVDTDPQSCKKYCQDMANELDKYWDNHTMYTQQLHYFELDSYILVRPL